MLHCKIVVSLFGGNLKPAEKKYHIGYKKKVKTSIELYENKGKLKKGPLKNGKKANYIKFNGNVDVVDILS